MDPLHWQNGDRQSGYRKSGRRERNQASPESSFQPASSRDLQRFPPQTGECRRTRAILRDYCDGELTSFLQSKIDEHVHGCRDCGLALSRHELEVMRLRAAFAAECSEIDNVPQDLTFSVMSRLGGVEGQGADRALGWTRGQMRDASDPVPQGFTGRVMNRVRMEWHPGYAHERAVAIVRKGLVLVPIAAVLVLSGLLWTSFLTRPEVGPIYHLESQTRGALSIQGAAGNWRPLAAMESGHSTDTDIVLPIGNSLDVGPGGFARIVHENAEGIVDLRVELEANTRVRFGETGLEVGYGALAIEGSVRVQAASLCEIHLRESAAGRQARGHLALLEVQRPDHALIVENPFRLRLEMESGEAEIWRAGERLQTVRMGQVAELDHWSGIRVGPAMTMAMVEDSRRNGLRPSRDPFTSRSVSWEGNLRAALSGQGMAGVDIEMSSDGMLVKLTSSPDGSFLVPEGLLRGESAVIRVRSQAGTAGYAGYGPEAIDLRHLRAGLLPAIELSEDRPVDGIVRSIDRRGVENARILPVVIDELFQLVDPLDESATQSDSEGRFVLRGLPVKLPAHVHIGLLVDHADYPSLTFLDLGRGELGQIRSGLDLVLAQGREQQLHGLSLDERCEVFETIAGLPRRAFAVRHEVRSSPEGVVTLTGVGRGPFWYLDAERGHLVELAQSSDGQSPRDYAFSMPIPKRSPFGHRYSQLGDGVTGDRAELMTSVVMQDELQSMAVSGARLFIRVASSGTRYLGRYDGSSSLQFHVPRGSRYALFGVSPRGDLGTLSSAMLPDPDLGSVAALNLQRAGSVWFTGNRVDADEHEVDGQEAALRGPMLLRFLRLDGMLAGDSYWRLVNAQGGWRADRLPSGRYRVIGSGGVLADCRIAAGAQTEIAYPR